MASWPGPQQWAPTPPAPAGSGRGRAGWRGGGRPEVVVDVRTGEGGCRLRRFFVEVRPPYGPSPPRTTSGRGAPARVWAGGGARVGGLGGVGALGVEFWTGSGRCRPGGRSRGGCGGRPPGSGRWELDVGRWARARRTRVSCSRLAPRGGGRLIPRGVWRPSPPPLRPG